MSSTRKMRQLILAHLLFARCLTSLKSITRIALLGSAPKGFFQRTKGDRVQNWFDENGVYNIEAYLCCLFTHLVTGKWKGAAHIPKATLEDAEKRLEGEEKALFLNSIWNGSAKELLDDLWLSNSMDIHTVLTKLTDGGNWSMTLYLHRNAGNGKV